MLSQPMKIYRGIFFLTVVLLFFNQLTISQETIVKKGTMNLGFEAGMQFTGINDPFMPISDGGIGYCAGPFFEYYLTDMIKFRGGVNIDNRAFTLKDMGYINDSAYDGKTSYFDVTEKYNVNYFTIPVSLIYVKGNDKFNIFIQATLYYSLLINSNQTGDFHIHISEEDAPHFHFEGYPEFNMPGDHYFETKKNVFSTSDIGINMLFGTTLYIKPNIGITLSPGFSYSFANVWENPERQTTWSHLYKINAGIVYTLKSK